MEDFENKNNDAENKARPEYYNPGEGNTQQSGNVNPVENYYTPPKTEQPPVENTTYHYSYTNQQNSANQANYDYYNQNFNQENSAAAPPKKSRAGIVIIVVLVVCLVIAGIALVVSGLTGAIGDLSDKNTTQSQSVEDKKLSDSEEVPLKDSDNNYTVAGVAANSIDSCVGITVYSKQADAYNYFFGYGQNNSSSNEPSKSGEGSGVLMSEANGKTYVLTCAHVISDGDSFKVTLNDDTVLDATLVGFDAQTDIGVLSIDKTGLQIADFADSEKLVVGEQVVAIGCPGGLEFKNSVTSGYISALARPVSSSIGYDTECIQTDAAINPGNSGGALFNMQGQVIGINSSKIASTEYEGMGFAVPSKTAIDTANSLIKVGYVEGRAKIGITYSPITSFNNSSAIIQALEEKGFKDAQGTMVISEISSDSDLVSKGIQQYDMIVAINGETLTSTDIMTSALADSKPGDTVKLTIARIENNEIKIREIDCTLIESKG